MFKKLLLVFLFSAVFLSVFQPWGRFRDPDAFYHAEMTRLIREQGPVKQFPWLDLTSLGKHYADHHFLLHVMTIPIQMLVEWVRGASVDSDLYAQQISVILFGGLLVMLWFGIVWQICRLFQSDEHSTFWKSSLWTILFITSAPMLMRLSFAKGSGLALSWFVLGIYAMIRGSIQQEKKRLTLFLAFLAGFGFALSHGGWIILLGCQFLMLIGWMVFVRFVEDKSWKQAIRSAPFFLWIICVFGVISGLILHPNFPDNLWFLWVQVIKIGVLTPSRVLMGGEWAVFTPMNLLVNIAPLIMVFLMMVFGLVFALKKMEMSKARVLIQLFVPLAVLCAMTFKSQRVIEYFIPVVLLCLLIASELIDWKKCVEESRLLFQFRFVDSRVIVRLFFLLFAVVIFSQSKDVYQVLHREGRSFDFFAGAMSYLNGHAQSGERIFHVDWDEFPNLFLRGERFRFISGLDPTFLLEENPELSDLHRDLLLGKATSSVGFIIRDRFHADYVIVDKQRPKREMFAQEIEVDQAFKLLFEDEEAKVYRVASGESEENKIVE